MNSKPKQKKGEKRPVLYIPTWALAVVPLCLGLAWYAYAYGQRQRAVQAVIWINSKGVDVTFTPGSPRTVRFTDANVTDEDLAAFVPAFNGYAPPGFERIGKLRLNRSAVSDDAVERFRLAVPNCEVER